MFGESLYLLCISYDFVVFQPRDFGHGTTGDATSQSDQLSFRDDEFLSSDGDELCTSTVVVTIVGVNDSCRFFYGRK